MKREQIEAEYAKITHDIRHVSQIVDFAQHIAKLAVEQEREACAQLCDTMTLGLGDSCADAIRARSGDCQEAKRVAQYALQN